jgi:AcrR family transcriptional regulator
MARVAESTRAQPLSVEKRRAMLIDAVTPLLLEFGPAVTTKQIAESACVAEGTIFRAFESKEELIRAAVAKSLDPEDFREQLRAVDFSVPLEERLRSVVELLAARFSRVFSLMTMMGPSAHPRHHDDARREFTMIVAETLAADAEGLNLPPERAAQIVRMVVLAASVPQIRNGDPFDAADLTSLILYGIAGAPRAT